jgi:TnpA family transposase
MPAEFLTDVERERYQRIPSQLSPQELLHYAYLSEADLALIHQQRRDSNRLGFAVQLALLRWLCFLPEQWWKEVPWDLLSSVA